MFEAASMLYLYVETPLHAGTGRGLGAIDLPIQRERLTDYPIVQASSVKGRLRSAFYLSKEFEDTRLKHQQRIKQELVAKEMEKGVDRKNGELDRIAEQRSWRDAAKALGYEAVFGPDTEGAAEHAGAFSPGDARLLLFPVRSLAGVFAWTTSLDVLERFKREAKAAKVNLTDWPDLAALRKFFPPQTSAEVSAPPPKALLPQNSAVEVAGKLVLEEFTFDADTSQHEAVSKLADWIGKNAFPDSNSYFAQKLKTSLVILDEDSFREFTQFATEVVTRVQLDYETKTVKPGALWTEESLPTDTVLYAPLMATPPRNGRDEHGKRRDLPEALQERNGSSVINFVKNRLDNKRLQLGGDETVGRGTVYLRFSTPQSLLNEPSQPQEGNSHGKNH